MIAITAFDRNKQGVATVAMSDANSAAQVALQFSSAVAIIKIVDGAWSFVYPTRARPSKDRLAHIIETHANVEFA